MIDKIITYTNNEGNLSVLHPCTEMFDSESRTRKDLEQRGITFASDEEVLTWIIDKDVPKNVSYSIINRDDLPSSRDFRNAWKHDSVKNIVAVDIPKAKDIVKDKFRLLRKPKLDALDVQYMKSLEANDIPLQQEIIRQKQILRDVTKLVLPDTESALREYLPNCLKDDN